MGGDMYWCAHVNWADVTFEENQSPVYMYIIWFSCTVTYRSSVKVTGIVMSKWNRPTVFLLIRKRLIILSEGFDRVAI